MVRRQTRRAHRGGSQRSSQNNNSTLLQRRIDDARRLLELDRRDLEKIEDTIGSLEQDVEVLTKKMREQRPNNQVARAQIQDDLILKRRALRKEKEWRETYMDHVRTGEARLRVLLRRESSNATA